MKQILFFVFTVFLALEVQAHDAKVLFENGKKALEAQEYENAEKLFEEALKLDKKNTNFYLHLGISQQKATKYKKSITSFKQAIKNDEKNVRAYIHKGISLDSLEKYQEAYKEYIAAKKLKADDAEINFHLGFTAMKFKNYTQGIAFFNRSLMLDKTYALSYFHRAYCKFRMVDSFGSCRDWKEASKLGIKEAEAFIKKHCD